MKLDEDFKKFVASNRKATFKEKANSIITTVQRKISFNKTMVEVGVQAAKALVVFSINKNPLSLLQGAFEITKAAIDTNNFYPDTYFTESKGWKLLSVNGLTFDGMFTSVLTKYDQIPLNFQYQGDVVTALVNLPIGQISYLRYPDGKECIYYQFNFLQQDILLDFLVAKKLSELQTNVISIVANKASEDSPTKSINLVSEKIFPIQSIKSKFYKKYITRCLDLGINRALLFYGPPGTGKTTLSQTIIQELGFRTLKFRYSDSFDFNTFCFIVRNFKIEAVLIDDFDQVEAKNELLEFLEILRKETKLVIGLVNSLKGFHPAIIRPGRFDEVIIIDALEPEIVNELLGDLVERFATKVSSWPVAYINELVFRSKLLTSEQLDAAYLELDERVKNQLKELKDGKDE